MRLRTNQSGFSVVEVLVVVVVLGLVGFISYSFYNKQADTDKTTDGSTSQSASQSATADDVPAAPELTSTDDLDTASAMLDESDTASSNDSTELDAQLQSF
jgi:prepilin-type N-terminal cleavage/methylation domain-containing protein